MNYILRCFSALFIIILFSNCSQDSNENPLLGSWKLEEWSVGLPLQQMVPEGISENYLAITNCSHNEILAFDRNGIVSGHDTFNPELYIKRSGEDPFYYEIEEVCAEGSIGFAVSYEQPEARAVEFNNAKGYITDGKLQLVYKNAIDIYSQDKSEVVERRDLTLTYRPKK